MGFRGDLSTINLADLFQTLSANQKVGTLIVADGESRKCIYFGAEGVRLLSTGKRRGLHLGEMLVRSGKITQNELQDALAIQKKLGLMLGEVFQKVGLVTKEEVQAAIRQQIEEEIYDLFSWKEANFEFQEGALPPPELLSPDQPVIFAVFDSNSLVMEAARRLDEWEVLNRGIPDHRVIFIPALPSDQLPPAAPATDASILLLTDGTRNVERIIADSHASKFDACSKLYRLLQQGVLKPATADDLRALAQSCWSAGDQDRACAVLQAAVDIAPEDAAIRQPLAQMLKFRGKWPEAAQHYNVLAQAYLRQNLTDQAFVAYQAALECHPTNLESRAGLFGIHMKRDSHDRALGEAKILVPALMAEKEWDRARAVCQEMLAVDPTSLEMRVHLANVLQELGDKGTAQAQLKQALDALPARATQDLTALYERILTIDPTRKDILSRLEKYIGDHRSRQSKILRRRTTGAMLGAALSVCALWLLYEGIAGRGIDALCEEARTLAKLGNYDAGVAKLQPVISGYPFTRAASRARREQDTIVHLRDRARQDAEELDRHQRDRYAQLLNQGASLEDENPVSAMATYQEVMAWALDPANRAADLCERAKKRIENLNRYFTEAEEVAAAARKLEESGRYDEARDRWKKLLSSYRKAPAAESITFPLRVETVPRGARILRDGVVVGAGPVLLRLRPGEGCDLRVEARGFLPQNRPVRSGEPATVVVSLEKTFLWQFTADGAIETRPVTTRDRVLFGSRDRILYALERASGTVAWKFAADVSGDFLSSPLLAGGTVIAGSNDGYVYGVRLNDGKLAWKYRVGKFVKSSPALAEAGRLAIFGGCDGRVHAVRVDSGEAAWTFPTGGEVLSSPAVLRDLVYVGSDDGTLYALAAATGKKAWGAKLGDMARGGVTASPAAVLIGCLDGKLYAFSPSGAPLWQFATRGAITAQPVVAEGLVLVGSRDGALYAVDLARGTLAWRCDTGKPITGAVAVSGKTVFAGSESGALLALELATGQILWKLQSGGPIHSTPAVDDGAVYFGNDDRHLFALEE
ncbi:MAG: PQQ-binding-like beta-propeller repeat protein [Planctomycetes bacterium]|nr:PQQ-binding-like beta-propeller repeat protein [Planctomycetota bacterium]